MSFAVPLSCVPSRPPQPGVRWSARGVLAAWLLCAVLPWLGACSAVKTAGVNAVAGTLSAGGAGWAVDDDPELIREALPFALKTQETLLAEVPNNGALLLATCRSFTQYAYAYVETEALLVEAQDYRLARSMKQRALSLYLRARDYCLRSLAVRTGVEVEEGLLGYETHRAVRAQVRRMTSRLRLDTASVLHQLDVSDRDLTYWTGAAWGAAVSLGLDRPELAADVPIVRTLIEQALEFELAAGGAKCDPAVRPQLQPTESSPPHALAAPFCDTTIYETLISLDALPEALGGSLTRARQHFQDAVNLSGGFSASAYVSMATSVCVQEQKRDEFVSLLERALAIDVDADSANAYHRRLANLIAQQRARHLLAVVDDFFI